MRKNSFKYNDHSSVYNLASTVSHLTLSPVEKETTTYTYSLTAEGLSCHLWLIHEVSLEGSCIEHLIINSLFTVLLWKFGEALEGGPSLEEDH